MIVQRVQAFLSLDQSSDHLPWALIDHTSVRTQDRITKIKAIESHLGVFPDGSSAPLTSRQKLLFGSALGMLEYKIKKARLGAKEIVEIIETLKPWEADVKDTRLIRHFILECLSPCKRFVLERTNTAYEGFRGTKPSWFGYICAWTFITGTLCFFVYWIFAWGLYEGGDTLAAWGAVYGTGLAQDFLLVTVTKILLVDYLPAQAMQAQLIRIRRTLADVSLNFINRHENSRDSDHLNESDAETISVVQHMSAACRAARSD